MKILFLTQILPYPPNAGPRVKTWHVIRHLANQGADITLVSFIRPEETTYVSKLEETCKKVIAVHIHRNRILDGYFLLSSFLNGKSFLVQRDDLKPMKERIAEVIEEENFDVIHADQLTMAQYALFAKEILQKSGRPTPALIFDAHNATWTIMDRMRNQVAFYFKPLVKREMRTIRDYEHHLVSTFNHTLSVTEIDRRALLLNGSKKSKLSDKITVVPIAVDTAEIKPLHNRNVESHQIVTMGTLHYPPNADGIRWFLQAVFPRILEKDPLATLTIIGKNPPSDFYQFSSQYPDKITITGYVDELDPYLQNASVMVVPVLAGGGMRVRILESFAKELPVVTTTIGLEGIDAVNNRDVIIADSAEDFSNGVVQLLNNTALQKQIAANGRNLVEQKYDWKVVFSRLDQIYENLVSKKRKKHVHE